MNEYLLVLHSLLPLFWVFTIHQNFFYASTVEEAAITRLPGKIVYFYTTHFN